MSSKLDGLAILTVPLLLLPRLDKALDQIRKEDVLVIWKLDRLGHSLRHLLSIIEDLKERGAHFASIQDGFDTSTASGENVTLCFVTTFNLNR